LAGEAEPRSAGYIGVFCRVAANVSAFPGSKGMRAQFVSHRKFHRQNANSQFQALFRNIFCVSCCCKKPSRGKNPNRNSLSLFNATHFSTPSKVKSKLQNWRQPRGTGEKLIVFALQPSPLPHSKVFMPLFLACPASPSALPQSLSSS